MDSRKAIKEWWQDRSIPKSRRELLDILRRNGYSNSCLYLLKNLGLSLSDCFWVRPSDGDYEWRDVNFFTNGFNSLEIDFNGISPSASLGGEMRKYWRIGDGGVRELVKFGKDETRDMQCVNEVFCHEFHERMGKFASVEYRLEKNGGVLSAVCPCFTSQDIEYVPMYYMFKSGQPARSRELALGRRGVRILRRQIRRRLAA